MCIYLSVNTYIHTYIHTYIYIYIWAVERELDAVKRLLDLLQLGFYQIDPVSAQGSPSGERDMVAMRAHFRV